MKEFVLDTFLLSSLVVFAFITTHLVLAGIAYAIEYAIRLWG